MISEHRMSDVYRRTLGHVAGQAIVRRLRARFAAGLAAGVFVAGQTLLTVVLNSRRSSNRLVDAVTASTPKSGSTHLLTPALRKLLNMTGHREVVRLFV